MKQTFKILIQPQALSLLDRVRGLFAERGITAYLVGGFVRDMRLGRDTADIDIAVSGNALEIAPEVATALDGKYVLLDETNRTGRVILPRRKAGSSEEQWVLDFSSLKGNIEQDLWLRDFTIDALAIDLKETTTGPKAISPPVIDPGGGLADLERRVIRATSPQAFKADPARLIRAVRLAAELDFTIEPATESRIRYDCQLLSSVAGERVREELLRILAAPRTERFLSYLDELGLLATMIPELIPSKGVIQPKEHNWNVFEHSLKTVAAVEFLLRQGDWKYAPAARDAVPWSPELGQHFDREVSRPSSSRSLMKLAALLHDIAKPQTKAIDAGGRMRFLGHPQEGADTAAATLERLRFSGKEIKLVTTMIRHHLRPVQMSPEGIPTHRAIYRYFRDCEDAGIDILFLSLADHLATRGPHLDPAAWQAHAEMVAYVLDRHFEEPALVAPPRLVNGHDLIAIFNLSPGPGIGSLLEATREAQAAGEINNREEALAYVREHLLAKAI
ncbi:CCA tRNA nucleotidyltransferase [Chloroflexota bacterium]